MGRLAARRSSVPLKQEKQQQHILVTASGVFERSRRGSISSLPPPPLSKGSLHVGPDDYRIMELHPHLLPVNTFSSDPSLSSSSTTKNCRTDAPRMERRRSIAVKDNISHVMRHRAQSFGSVGSGAGGWRGSVESGAGKRRGSMGGHQAQRPKTEGWSRPKALPRSSTLAAER